MDRITLILESPGEPNRVLNFETAPGEATQTEPHLLTLHRLPHGGTYRESHGAAIAPLLLRGTFGYEKRTVDGQSMTGFELFKQLRDLYREYVALMGTKDPYIKNGVRLQYHNHTEGEHWYAEASEFRTPRSAENRRHYIYEIDIKLVTPAQRPKLATSKPDKKTVIRQSNNSIKHQQRQVQDLLGSIKKILAKKDQIVSQIETKILKPLAELQADIEQVVRGARDAILYPINKAKELVNNIKQTITDIGALVETAITEGVHALHGLRKTVIDLLATPQAFAQSIVAATQEFAGALSEWQNVFDDVALAAAGAGSTSQARAVAARSINQSAKGARRAETRANDTLPKIAARELGDAGRWHEIALLNGLEDAPYIDAVGGPGKRKWGEPLLIPTDTTQAGQGVVGAYEDGALTYQRDTDERLYGRDIRLFERDGKLDIRFAQDGKLATIAGRPNLGQAITLKTRIYQGQLLESNAFGMRRLVGTRMGAADLDLAKWATTETILTDTRIKSVEVELDAQGNLIESDLIATPIGASDTRTTDGLVAR